MHTTEEKQSFSKRLKIALRAAAPKAQTVNEIAIQFNLRHEQEPVSNQAVHKWLIGQAIPSREKIETLAKWLNVSTEWLRTGHDAIIADTTLSALSHIMLNRFVSLSERQQLVVIELIDNFKNDVSI